MQFLARFAILIVSISLFPGCKKAPFKQQSAASLRIINALMEAGSLKLNTGERDSVLMHNAKSFGLPIVDGEASIQVWPARDVSKPVYSNKQRIKEGDIYSLYLFGWPGIVKSILIKEQVPTWYTDSVLGVRVAHLASGVGPINITLKKNPTALIFRNIGYEAVSDIVKIPLPGVIPSGSASFEIRDAADDKILVTYTLPTNANALYPGISIALQRFKNITLVMKGSRDTLSGPNAFGVFPVAMSY